MIINSVMECQKLSINYTLFTRYVLKYAGIARALLPCAVPELPIRSRIFTLPRAQSQLAVSITGRFDKHNALSVPRTPIYICELIS